MPEQLFHSSNDLNKRVQAIATSKRHYCRVVACVDSSHHSRKAISHAITVAKALGAELILMHVIEAKPNYGTPSDPVEWDLRRQEACAQVEKLAQERADEVQGIQTQVLEGRAADQICIWAQGNQVDLMVLCSHGEGD